MEYEPSGDIDPIWTSSRTARQIYALGEVERVCSSAPSPTHPANRTTHWAGHWASALPRCVVSVTPHAATDGRTRR